MRSWESAGTVDHSDLALIGLAKPQNKMRKTGKNLDSGSMMNVFTAPILCGPQIAVQYRYLDRVRAAFTLSCW